MQSHQCERVKNDRLFTKTRQYISPMGRRIYTRYTYTTLLSNKHAKHRSPLTFYSAVRYRYRYHYSTTIVILSFCSWSSMPRISPTSGQTLDLITTFMHNHRDTTHVSPIVIASHLRYQYSACSNTGPLQQPMLSLFAVVHRTRLSRYDRHQSASVAI